MPKDADRPPWRRSALFYDRIAGAYDDHLAGSDNALTRRQFQALVAAAVPAGGALLDLGCGTGLDAQWYAEQGYRVTAYDVSAEMIARLRARCAEAIGAGQVVPWTAPYPAFLDELPRRE